MDMGLDVREIPRGLAGLPVNPKRAAKLARRIASRLETPTALVALVELLLGVAPLATTDEDMPEGLTLSHDLWARYCSAFTAIETLYTYSDEYADLISEYMLQVRPKYDPIEGEHLTDDNQIKRMRRK
jgi:hypothetical protein